MKWLVEFLCMPHQKSITQLRIESMKMRTKKELIKNWEQILDGRVVNKIIYFIKPIFLNNRFQTERKIWEYQLDITAPQIFFIEHFSDPNSAMAVIDFGRLQLRNNPDMFEKNQNPAELISKESEDDGNTNKTLIVVIFYYNKIIFLFRNVYDTLLYTSSK